MIDKILDTSDTTDITESVVFIKNFGLKNLFKLSKKKYNEVKNYYKDQIFSVTFGLEQSFSESDLPLDFYDDLLGTHFTLSEALPFFKSEQLSLF